MPHECDDFGGDVRDALAASVPRVSDDESIVPGGDAGNLVEAGGLTEEIDDHLDRAAEGDVTAVHDAVAAFETALSEAVDVNDGGDTHRDVFWPYYERVADTLADATQTADRSSSVTSSRRTTQQLRTRCRWRHPRLRTQSDDT